MDWTYENVTQVIEYLATSFIVGVFHVELDNVFKKRRDKTTRPTLFADIYHVWFWGLIKYKRGQVYMHDYSSWFRWVKSNKICAGEVVERAYESYRVKLTLRSNTTEVMLDANTI
jgi:hypothetical protein